MQNYPGSFPHKTYLVYARLPVYKKRLARAKRTIDEATDKGIRWYVACSAGKDSTVLAHLVNSICPGIEIWSEKDDCDFPGEREYLEETARQYGWNLNIVSPKVSVWDSIAKMSKLDVCDEIHSRGTAFSDNFFYSLVSEQENKFDGVFMGLRAQESIGRRTNFRVHGEIYRKKNGKWVCNPLSTWKGEDIFAYLVSNEVPILPVYFNTKFVDGDPTKIRKSWMLPGARSNQGHCVWLKYYYPELFYKLAQVAPEVLSYA